MKALYPSLQIIFLPEFLREAHLFMTTNFLAELLVLEDKDSSNIGDLFKSISKNNPKVFYMSSDEAESVKLFSNAYLANRVSFFVN